METTTHWRGVRTRYFGADPRTLSSATPFISHTLQLQRRGQRLGPRPVCVRAELADIRTENEERNADEALASELLRYRAVVAYDGTDFHGFQRQGNSTACPTIQSQLETVLQRRLGYHPWRCQVVGAGRTDAGVHARGQVIHFDIPKTMASKPAFEPPQLQYALNQLLPRTIQVRAVEVAPPPSRQLHPMPPCEEHKALPWHAIYRAQGKLYVYRMFAGEWIDPLLQRYVYSEYRPLPKWAEATALLQAFVGTHDFGAFAHTPPNKADRQRARLSTVRTVRRIDLVPDRDGGFVPVWQFQFELNGALYRMIRNLIGTFLAVARGDLEAELVLSALQRGAQGRTHIATRVKPAPAHGLCLEKVFYADGYPQKCDYQSGVLTKNADAPQRSARGAPNPVSNVLT